MFFNNVFEQHIAAIGKLPPPVEALKHVREAIAFIPALRSIDVQPKILEQIIDEYQTSIMAVFLTVAGIGAVGFFASLFTRELTLERDDLGRQQFEKSS